MALPADFNTGRVTGHFVDLLGQPVVGKVTFTARARRFVSDATDTVVIGSPIVVALDASGELDVNLPATDDGDITPVDWTYHVREEFGTGPSVYTNEYEMDVPAGSETDLSEVVSVDPDDGTTVIREGGGLEGADRADDASGVLDLGALISAGKASAGCKLFSGPSWVAFELGPAVTPTSGKPFGVAVTGSLETLMSMEWWSEGSTANVIQPPGAPLPIVIGESEEDLYFFNVWPIEFDSTHQWLVIPVSNQTSTEGTVL